MSARRKPSRIPAANWWKGVSDTFRVVAEYLAMAKRAELRDEGHECGHTFRVCPICHQPVRPEYWCDGHATHTPTNAGRNHHA